MIVMLFAGMFSINIHAESDDPLSTDTNTLSISKTVQGNEAAKARNYEFTVTFVEARDFITWKEATAEGSTITMEALLSITWADDDYEYCYDGAGEWTKTNKMGEHIGTVASPSDESLGAIKNSVPYDPASVPASVSKIENGTYSFSLKDSGTVVFSSIPSNVYYTVTEKEYQNCDTYVDDAPGREVKEGKMDKDNSHVFTNKMKVSVKYDGNGADNPDTMDSKGYTGTYSSSLNAEKNLYIREGFTFKGWNTEKNGTGKSYKPNDSLAQADENITLYAQWSEVKKKKEVTTFAIPKTGD